MNKAIAAITHTIEYTLTFFQFTSESLHIRKFKNTKTTDTSLTRKNPIRKDQNTMRYNFL